MPGLADLVNELITLIPEDGSRITNDELRAALERTAGEPISNEELKQLKSRVVALGAAEGVKGPGGGLRAPGVEPPPRAAVPAAGTRPRRSGNGSAEASPQPTIAPATTAASVLTGDLRNKVDQVWDAFWSGGISNPLEVLEQLTYLLFIRRLDEMEKLEERLRHHDAAHRRDEHAAARGGEPRYELPRFALRRRGDWGRRIS